MPSDWRTTLAVNWEVADGWNVNASAVYVRTKEGLAFRDIRARPLVVNGVQALTPDGRIRYDGLAAARRIGGADQPRAARANRLFARRLRRADSGRSQP